jgi:hypothetical protein
MAMIVIPMMLIVIFLVVEIWPIWVVLDGNFIDIFIKYSVLIEQKDLRAPLLMNARIVEHEEENSDFDHEGRIIYGNNENMQYS